MSADGGTRWDEIPEAFREYVVAYLAKELQESIYQSAKTKAEMHVMVAGMSQGTADLLGDKQGAIVAMGMAPVLGSLDTAAEARRQALYAAIRKLSER